MRYYNAFIKNVSSCVRFPCDRPDSLAIPYEKERLKILPYKARSMERKLEEAKDERSSRISLKHQYEKSGTWPEIERCLMHGWRLGPNTGTAHVKRERPRLDCAGYRLSIFSVLGTILRNYHFLDFHEKLKITFFFPTKYFFYFQKRITRQLSNMRQNIKNQTNSTWFCSVSDQKTHTCILYLST